MRSNCTGSTKRWIYERVRTSARESVTEKAGKNKGGPKIKKRKEIKERGSWSVGVEGRTESKKKKTMKDI